MGIDEVINGKRHAILSLANKYGFYNVRVFGSVARGDAGPDSDVDLLVNVRPDEELDALESGAAGMEFETLWVELEKLLGREVDLVPEDSLRGHLREKALREAIPL